MLLGNDIEHFRTLECSEESSDILARQNFDGNPIGESWEPLRVWWDEVEIEKDKGDFPLFGSCILVNERVVSEIGDVLLRNGELLPLAAPGERIYLYNVTTLIDALDLTKSKGVRFASGRYGRIQKHVFVEDGLKNALVFKLPQLRFGNYVYVTDEFMRIISSKGLRGLNPQEVWSSENGATWLA